MRGDTEFVRRAELAELIRQTGLQRSEIARESGVHERVLYRIARGVDAGAPGYRGEFVSFETADRICTALGLPLPDVVDRWGKGA